MARGSIAANEKLAIMFSVELNLQFEHSTFSQRDIHGHNSEY
jgi:hypothetical protein